MSQARMLDASANNHPTDREIGWASVHAAGYSAVMIKCSEGVDYVNPWLARDAVGAKAAGLLVGFYHFRHPGLGAPSAEAHFALTAIAGLRHDLGLAQDLEITEGESWRALAKQAQAFHSDIRMGLGHCPLYVNDDFRDNLPGAPWGERLWSARTDRPRFECWAWQETTPVAVPGILGLTDVGWLRPALSAP